MESDDTKGVEPAFSGVTMRTLRERANLSQRALAEACGIALRSIVRFESGEQEPRFGVALRIADALDVDMSELAGRGVELDLAGVWHARWQVWLDGEEAITEQEVVATPVGLRVPISASERGIMVRGGTREPVTIETGGYRWDGELRLHSDRALIGWYSSTEGRVRSLGALFLVVGESGAYLYGRWVGTAREGLVVTGWSVLARDSDRATSVMTHLLVDGRP